MPVIENLKNLIRDRGHHNTAARGSPSSSSASGRNGHRKSRSGGRHSPARSSVPPSQQQASAAMPTTLLPQQPTQAHIASHQELSVKPATQYAPQNPRPGTESEAQVIPAVNSAAQPSPQRFSWQQQPKQREGKSPGVAAKDVGGQAVREHWDRAEALIEKAKKERGKMPVYEGLPEWFVLLEKMGDGAFSNVYKALDRRTEQKVAIKCVRKYELNRSQVAQGKHFNADIKKIPRATERANILKEVSIMQTLNHPNLVKLISFTESREYYFLVLELMGGGELFHRIVKLTYFSEELARHVILQVARGIRYLHEERGVVHRDIKPENLLFESIHIIPSKHPKVRPYDEEKEDEGEFVRSVGGGGIGQVKIADFGLSKIVWAEDTATPCGTVGYTAPEIVKDERYSKSVDMWAMGCVLYTLLCGFPPFFDESIQVLTEKVARGYYTYLSPWWDDISASSKDLISHLLCVDPEKRYTIDEFLAHPWCKEKQPQLAQDLTTAPAVQRARRINYAPIDSPLLQAQQGAPPQAARTPGVNQLREAFDVTYAVHRMEEEGARRAKYGIGGAGAAGGVNAGVLHGLNEENEDEEAIEAREKEENRRRYGQEVSQAIEDQRRARQQQPPHGAAQQVPAGQYQGWGGARRVEAEAALYGGRAGTRDRGGRRAGGFELNMAQATLLGRRKMPAGALA